MTVAATPEVGLVRALTGDSDALPADLAALRRCLGLIGDLLEEKANECEADRDAAELAAAEVDTLLGLEMALAERAIGVRAGSIEEMRTKLEIWRVLVATDGDCDLRDPRNRLILSIEADLERFAAASRRHRAVSRSAGAPRGGQRA